MIVCHLCGKPPVRDGKIKAACPFPCRSLFLELYDKRSPDFGLWAFVPDQFDDAAGNQVPNWISLKVGRSGRSVRVTRVGRSGIRTDEIVPPDRVGLLVQDFFDALEVAVTLHS